MNEKYLLKLLQDMQLKNFTQTCVRTIFVL